MQPSELVTQAHIDQYKTDGVTCIRSAVSPEWIEKLIVGIDHNRANPSERGRLWNRDERGGTTFYDSQVWRTNPQYRDFVLNSDLAEICGRVMGVSGVNFFFDSVFVRSEGVQFRTPFHQDEPFWSVEGYDCSSAWMPLNSVEKRSCLEFVRGSHRWEETYKQQNFGELTGDARDQVQYDDEPGAIDFPDIEGRRDEFDIISWDMEPGDVALFNARIIHGGSGLLQEGRDLKVFNTQYLGDDVRIKFRERGMDPDHSQVMTAAGLRPGDRVGGELYPELWRNVPRV